MAIEIKNYTRTWKEDVSGILLTEENLHEAAQYLLGQRWSDGYTVTGASVSSTRDTWTGTTEHILTLKVSDVALTFRPGDIIEFDHRMHPRHPRPAKAPEWSEARSGAFVKVSK